MKTMEISAVDDVDSTWPRKFVVRVIIDPRSYPAIKGSSTTPLWKFRPSYLSSALFLQ